MQQQSGQQQPGVGDKKAYAFIPSFTFLWADAAKYAGEVLHRGEHRTDEDEAADELLRIILKARRKGCTAEGVLKAAWHRLQAYKRG